MATFSFTVDTNPMANSIDGVAHHVDGVTAAVVAMETAVVIAEREGANSICANVNTGFHSLIRSQISQKIARLKSVVDAKTMELQQQSFSLVSIKTRMEKDYNMIANRYTKLFTSLNKALRSRIFEIDRATTTFINQDILPTSNRTKRLSAVTSIMQLESIVGSQSIATSHTRHNAVQNISSMQSFILSSEKQKELIGTLLINESVENSIEKSIPIVITESGGLNVRQSQWAISCPAVGQGIGARIESHIYSALTTLKWSEGEASSASRIREQYGSIVSRSTLSNRVKKQMLSLCEISAWQTLSPQEHP